ncbi:MAG: DUF1501 domain-containing protein [Bryobacterales bacterium]|nr:DUF1501 domain-containing protein [Bryobacterales bacterium]MDE0295993.1 DUF1501 domain-containing protein [Bryobacterales bacterium]
MQQMSLRDRTRRHFFSQCFVGLGNIALGGLLANGKLTAGNVPRVENPLAPKAPHFTPKVKRVIYLFMAGAPSQFETWLYRPKLGELDGQPTPDSFLEGKRFAFMERFMKDKLKLLGPRRKFHQHGQSGTWVSEIFPHMAGVVDDLALVHSLTTENFNHAPAKLFFNTGSTRFGRPSMGAWLSYGLGSESQNLPAFVVLRSGYRSLMGGANLWSSGFLPTTYQGVEFLRSADPIPNLSTPNGISMKRQTAKLEAVRDLNLARLAEVGDPEIGTRISSYEMAYRMQTSGPELMDLSTENQATLDLYGAKPGEQSFANNCLLARRMIERGVRFVQLYQTGWDHHGNRQNNLNEKLDEVALTVDRPTAALIKDLKQRGLLEETLVIFGGEFGRTPMGEIRETVGRNHHIENFPMWFAGGGIKTGQTIGEVDELGFFITKDKVEVHDVQATILHLLGLDHEKLTFRYQGRDFRLTDVGGRVIKKLLA